MYSTVPVPAEVSKFVNVPAGKVVVPAATADSANVPVPETVPSECVFMVPKSRVPCNKDVAVDTDRGVLAKTRVPGVACAISRLEKFAVPLMD